MHGPENEVMALACKCASVLTGTREAWKDAAREAGILPLVAKLVRVKDLQVCVSLDDFHNHTTASV
jgi:hypothetical protein